jgi:hypothetical protein
MKQTAVEWLLKQLQESGIPLLKDELEFIEQAKKMEKQQMIEMHDKGFDSVEQLNDEYAIEFALWKETQVTQDDNGLYYGESRIAVSRKNPVDIYKILEIYKKEKGL